MIIQQNNSSRFPSCAWYHLSRGLLSGLTEPDVNYALWTQPQFQSEVLRLAITPAGTFVWPVSSAACRVHMRKTVGDNSFPAAYITLSDTSGDAQQGRIFLPNSTLIYMSCINSVYCLQQGLTIQFQWPMNNSGNLLYCFRGFIDFIDQQFMGLQPTSALASPFNNCQEQLHLLTPGASIQTFLKIILW